MPLAPRLIAAAVALCLTGPAFTGPALAQTALEHADFDRVFAITTFEHRVLRDAAQTPYPDTMDRFPDLFAMGGYRMEEPNEDNEWYARTYLWAPMTVVMHQGETVLLEFFGINGERHPTELRAPDGSVLDSFELARGDIVQLPFTPEAAGIHSYVSTLRLPGMVGQILVLPAP